MAKGIIVFDMDGTIADLYGVENWLEMLRSYDATPYEIAKPMVNMVILKELLKVCKTLGYRIAVTSWLSKESTEEYDEKVRQAKLNWLKQYDFPYDEVHFVKYGTTKLNCTRTKADYQILFDDNEKIRNSWNGGKAYSEKAILKNLIDIISEM